MVSPDGSIHTTHTPPPLSFYNTFKKKYKIKTHFSKPTSKGKIQQVKGEKTNNKNQIYFYLAF